MEEESIDVPNECMENEDAATQDCRRKIKTLRNQMVALKKSVTKGDKKQRKAIEADVKDLEIRLSELQLELEKLKTCEGDQELNNENSKELEKVLATRAKKAEKQQAKAMAKKQELEAAIEAVSLLPKHDLYEQKSLKDLLARERLRIERIAPDGNCLFNAIAKQLVHRYGKQYGPQDLRYLVSDHLKNNVSKYVGFIDNTELEGEELPESELVSRYCNKLCTSNMWGGHLELDAIAEFLNIPIKVYQADADPITFGNEQASSKPVLKICYCKFVYSLGEHYDSLLDDNLVNIN